MKTINVQNQEIKVEMSIIRKGYGIYSISAEFKLDDERIKRNFHCTDSELFDLRNDDSVNYQEYQEMLFQRVERELIELIEERIYQNEN